MKDQLAIVHGMIEQMHQHFLENQNLSSRQNVATSSTDLRPGTPSREVLLQSTEPLLTFAVRELPAGHQSAVRCSKASFHSEWLQDDRCKIFQCVCGSRHDLDFSCKDSDALRELTSTRSNKVQYCLSASLFVWQATNQHGKSTHSHRGTTLRSR